MVFGQTRGEHQVHELHAIRERDLNERNTSAESSSGNAHWNVGAIGLQLDLRLVAQLRSKHLISRRGTARRT